MALARAVVRGRDARRLPEVQAAASLQALRHVSAPPVVDLYRLRDARPPNSGDDLPQVLHVPAPVVLRLLPDDEHSVRYLREAPGTGDRGQLQDSVADAEQDPERADDR